MMNNVQIKESNISIWSLLIIDSSVSLGSFTCWPLIVSLVIICIDYIMYDNH